MRKSIIFLFFIILCPAAYAIGISPSMIKMDFQPGYEETFFFTISGTGSAKVTVHGSLQPYITVSDSILKNKDSFTVTIKLPEKMDTPGINKGFIEVVEIKETQEGMIAGVASIETPIYVRVPYPGIYVELGFGVPDVNVNETAYFYVDIKNLGTLNITRAYANIEVKDIENKTIAKLKTNEQPILASSRAVLKAEMSTAGHKPGVYVAYADVRYGEEQKFLSNSFRIGSLNIKIINYTKQFLKDTINKFEIELESGWNSKVKNLYAVIQITNSSGNIAELKTPIADLEPWSVTKLVSYWDTKDIGLGSYTAVTKLYYERKVDTHSLEVFVVKPKELEKPTILNFLTTTNLLIILFLLIIADVVWFIKRKKGRLKSTKKRL